MKCIGFRYNDVHFFVFFINYVSIINSSVISGTEYFLGGGGGQK